LYRFGGTCKLLRISVQEFIPSLFNVNKRLGRFFDDPESFRRMQARSGTLISGSFVLQTLLREVWDSTDLDLYIWPQQLGYVKRWLIAAGYTEYNPNEAATNNIENNEEVSDLESDIMSEDNNNADEAHEPLTDYTVDHLKQVLFFLKEVNPEENLRIQIMIPELCPLQTILRFHSSTSFMICPYQLLR
ncbi:hypothetical protein M422DRAFT_100702, partial [Sphaerobolus stellatus SS14]